jgi:ATP-dependent helicase HrpA
VSQPYTIDFPPDLPVSARRHEIEQAMREHQVIIVCGETGSGKTTQLPKIALAMGRAARVEGRRPQLIGHTQPRRIAASSVAKRMAQELNTELGEVVGYKVRFQDRLQAGAQVKLMTDGILLAETQRDPLLRAYDTLIIDEAHERSLNIDFLLGYLRQLLPRRRDLKVVITSATIDADRFARHFASPQGPAPVIVVSGRTYPVEQRYRPYEESRAYGLNHAISDAIDELWGGGAGGDILIFLPGEREIRDLAEHLRGHLSHQVLTRDAEILPLYSRLSQAEQDRVFDACVGRRIVLATNVAETSLTVPGIRYVIDVGTARVKRYSLRSKVEQLQIEPISQAAANQRAGRCGRVANGICIRLYDGADFERRPRFTDPEILRSSLASVILRMKSLGLGEVEAFPFIDPPSSRAIADGHQLLAELGAVDDTQQLTPLGRELARLPLDPRIGRMILEARERAALDEVLVIASALSVPDIRERPIDAQAQADQQHARFKDDKSEFSGYLTLWKWLTDARGGHGQTHKLSNRQYEQLLRASHLSVRRLREWRDVHSQLLTVVTEQGWKPNTQPATYEQIHLSMLSGLLGNIGCKVDDEEVYLGARGIKFHRHPGAHLRKKPGRWLVAAELVDTSRLYGRGLAAIEPTWLEQIGAHLLKKQWLDPHWDKRGAEVVAFERATLYGLVIYSGRRRPYAAVDPVGAREIFIREGLVAGAWEGKLPFLQANRLLVRQVQDLEHKSRRQDVLVDDELIFAYYDAHIPGQVLNARDLDVWWHQASRENPKLLFMGRDDLMRHEAASVTAHAFPRVIRLGGVDCATDYLHDPGDPRDGLTVTVPLFVLNQVSEERCEWLVPGMLRDKVQALLKSLPQKARSRFVPLPDSAARLADEMGAEGVFGAGSLTDALLQRVRQQTHLDVKRADFKLDMVPPHLFMNLRVVDEHGRQLGMGRNLGALRAEWGHQARGAFQALAQLKATARPAPTPGQVEPGANVPSRDKDKPQVQAAPAKASAGAVAPTPGPYTAWTFGEWPEWMNIRKGGQTLIGFPALVDQGKAVDIEVFDEPEVAARKHRLGLRRLFALHLKDALKYLEKNIPELQKMAVAYMSLGDQDGLRQQIIDLALDRAFLLDPLPTDAQGFQRRLDEGRGRLSLIANEVARLCAQILTEYAATQKKVRDSKAQAAAATDCAEQLKRLLGPHFVRDTPWTQLQHLSRYLRAIALRLDKCRSDPARDAQRMAEVRAQEQRYWRLVSERKGACDERMLEFRWLLEELRVSFFAQELRTPQPVSLKRLDKAWAQLS